MVNAGPVADLRKHSRHKVLKGGKLVSLKLHSAVDVTIIDMSISGARIRTPATVDFPEKFNLYIVSERLLLPAVVRWRSGDIMGIEFVGEPRHTALRKWDNHAPKSHSIPQEALHLFKSPGSRRAFVVYQGI
jgi:PilZ domain-containing protein